MTKHDIEQERAKFEAFASKHGMCVTKYSDLYFSHTINWMWRAWQAAIKADRQQHENEWKLAIDHELVTMQSTADSYSTAQEAVSALIDWHVAVATDPVVSGQQRGEPVVLDRYDAGLLGGQDGMSAHVWHDIIRSELDRAYDFYIDQLDRITAQPAAPAQEPSDGEIMSLAYDIGAMPEQMTDGSLLRFARALLARYGHPEEAEGWQLVPKDPTQEMFYTCEHIFDHGNSGESPFEFFDRKYKDILEAAPKFGEEK